MAKRNKTPLNCPLCAKERCSVRKPVRVENKVGRNDPCPCGSGKKYKKCCGR